MLCVSKKVTRYTSILYAWLYINVCARLVCFCPNYLDQGTCVSVLWNILWECNLAFFHTQFSWNPIKNRKQDGITSQLQILQTPSLLEDAQAFVAWLLLPTCPLLSQTGPSIPGSSSGWSWAFRPLCLCTYCSLCQAFPHLPSAWWAPVHISKLRPDITLGTFSLILSPS